MTNSNNAKLRWYQFSLRTVLIFVTFFAIACSWFAVKMQQAEVQRKIAESILKDGGDVIYEYEYDFSNNKYIPKSKSLLPLWLRSSLGDDFFYNVVFSVVKTEESLKQIQNLPKLRHLDIYGEKITDKEFEHIKGLTHLRSLELWSCNVTNEGLSRLNGLSHLQSLRFFGVDITDAGLEHLKELTQLQTLDLGNVAEPGKNPGSFACSHVTDEGLKRFQRAMPNCKITALKYGS